MVNCVSCSKLKPIIYRGMCQQCTRDFRYTRYRGWIERRAERLGKPMPREGKRRPLVDTLKAVAR